MSWVDTKLGRFRVLWDGVSLPLRAGINIKGAGVANVEDNVNTNATDITIEGGGGGGVPPSRAINTTAPITGGGTLAADLTIAIDGATTGARGSVRLANDLAGTADAPVVAKINGIGITGTPAEGHIPIATGPTGATWQSNPSAPLVRAINTTAPLQGGGDLSADRTLSVDGATSGARGVIRLTSDLAGTADAPTVAKVNGIGLSGTPSTGYIPIATGASAATWQTNPSTPLTRTISTTAPLTGGGDLSADLTLAVDGATSGARGVIRLTGDLAGLPDSPVVAKVNGIAITGTPSLGHIPIATGANAATWQANPSTPSTRNINTTAPLTGGGSLASDLTLAVSDATSGAAGVVRLTNDLGGTATAPVVAKVNGIAITGTPSAGHIPIATGASAATWQANPSAPTSRTISTTAPLQGGGDLSSNRTLTIDGATTGARGAVRLTQDLGGTADAPTVVALTGVGGIIQLPAIRHKVRAVAGNITVNSGQSDHQLYIDTSVARQIQLPDPATLAGFTFEIIDATGQCGTNAITMVRFGSELIMGIAASYVFQTNWGSWVVRTNGTNWFIR